MDSIIDKAQKQLLSIGIETVKENATLYILIEDTQLELSDFEIKFRAKIFDEEESEY